MAASYGHFDICSALLLAGAQIDALDSSERTPLMLALQHKHLKIMKLLIHHGANVNAREIHGESPIVASVWANDAEVVDLLLKSGAKNNPSDGLLQTAIYHHSPHMVSESNRSVDDDLRTMLSRLQSILLTIRLSANRGEASMDHRLSR